ncbi:non-ribosomal peptide synthetase [Streptomyces sp. NBC_01304]|uniref:non-ribosomal peptide synthetase n=1 Tax=Streptomyces sp. NBC_01304 TaxID=2903818 RepID=UPI002E13543B|nr:non-ribosomal peptide synthetase [Streptomyces sp. NBC_01304]WSJ88157.1 amino acid adenylation domain-containing protein [Streptomyces sp. NBC_01304]
MSVSRLHRPGHPTEGLLESLRRPAEKAPQETAFTFPRFDEHSGLELPPVRLTRGELDSRARALAVALTERGARRGRVLLLLPPGPAFVVGLFGCLYAGAAAVACAPPKEGTGGALAERFVQMGKDAEVAAVVAPRGRTAELRRIWAEGGAPQGPDWIEVDADASDVPAAPDLWTPPDADGHDLALLQYTSGSTGTPKGVMVTRDNLLEQLRVFRDLAELPDGADVVTWMPVYHALGIAGTVTMSQFVGGHCTVLTPDDFVAEPFRWLKAISDAQAPVFSCGPNFAYDRCVERVTPEQREQLDLGRWHAAFNAAERIQARTIEAFTDAFAPHGFRREAWFPGYGLTEVTLGISGRRGPDPLRLTLDAAALEAGRATPATTDTARTAELVGCGTPHPRVRMLVVDPTTLTECADGEVGEIWVAGDVVNQGYWQRPEQTTETFGGQLADGEGPFVRTGDLAFSQDGEIVVCGRLKELIIIRGRNIHPQDVESAARRAHPALETAPAAAFSVDTESGEQLVLVQSVESPEDLDLPALATEVRAAVAADQEVEAHTVVFVRPADIPMTGSGKIRRTTCRQAHLDGELTPLLTSSVTSAPAEEAADAEDPQTPASPLRDMVIALPAELRAQVLTAEIRRRVGALLRVDPASVAEDRPLTSLGLESLRTVELRHGLSRDFGVPLPLADFFRGGIPTVAGLIATGLTSEEAVTPGELVRPTLTPNPSARHEPFPLTEIQHAYLVGRSSGYELGSTSIHLYTEYASPDLDLPRLRRALTALVARHEMLRAVVASDGTQRILSEVGEVPVTEYDLREAPDEDQRAHLAALRAELSHQALPLDTWPMFDIHVTWLDGDRDGNHARVHIGIDLLIADVASIRLFFLELGDLYADPTAQLPPLDVSFRDYVLAAQELRDSPAYDTARAYWKTRIETLPPNPQLPLRAGTLPTGSTPLRTRRQDRLPAADWIRVKERAAARGLTPSAVQLAAYATVLGAWSRSGHFTLNVPLFNRHPLHPHIDRVIGDFTSVTLLEVDLRPGGGFTALAARMQRQLWQDMDHRLFSGVDVIREIARVRDVPPHAFSATVFASAREQGRDQDFTGGEVGADWLGETVYAVSQTPQVRLDHQVYEDRGDLTYKWDAVEETFPPGVLDDMFDAYTRLLWGLADEAGAWDAQGESVLPARQLALIEAANATEEKVPDGLLITDLVEQALTHPERTAVVGAGRELTYGELYRHACRLARQLRELGAGTGELVAVGIGKSVEQIVAVVAVQLAGTAYLPVDPALPTARREWLLAHSGARLALVAERGDWPATVGTLVVDLTTEDGDDSPLEPVQGPDALAYVLYTSGSTGTPKGVAVSHRAALNTCLDFADRCELNADDRVLGLSALGFDLSVADIFAVLGRGGALVLPAPSAVTDPARWLALMAEHRVTLWNSVPALMQMLVEHIGDAPAPPALRTLREVWLSGDWIPVDLPARIRSAAPAARVTSAGGATEAAIWSVAHVVTEDDAGRDSIPYGTALRNQTMEVLNDRLEHCPVGVTGEIHIGGTGLADGYWRDPERTAASFVTDPASGRRLYRTGDLGRWLPSGEIEILGREDFQVKIRGHRIELGEIEAALLRRPEVRAAAVTVIGSTRGTRRLAAVIVPETPPATQPGTTPLTYRADLHPDTAPAPLNPLTTKPTHPTPHTSHPPTAAPDRPAAQARTTPATYRADLGEGVLTDPLGRLAFKASRPGLRTDLPAAADRLVLPTANPPARTSRRTFAPDPLAVDAFAGLLGVLGAYEDATGTLKYRYASAGGLYPVQTYVHIAPGRIAGLDGGTYYLDPHRHRLVALTTGATIDPGVHTPDNQLIADSAAFTLLFVARRSAIEPLYGSRARDFCLIEAGLMAQLLDSAAPELGLGLCQVGVLHPTEALRTALALDDDHEVLHGMLGGSPDPEEAPAPEVSLTDTLRSALAATLPDYLVPATFVEADRLPLTSRGKLDREALRELAEAAEPEPTEPDDAAHTETEAKILAVLRTEPGLTALALHDHLLDLGVDSVAMVRLHRLLQTALDRRFPLVAMFEQPTAGGLAAYVTGLPPATEAEDPAATTRPQDRENQ